MFEAGLKYRSLNCYRSALSSALIPVDGFQVGQHPLVVRLMKGIFNSRPPELRYSQTWEVSQIIRAKQGFLFETPVEEVGNPPCTGFGSSFFRSQTANSS